MFNFLRSIFPERTEQNLRNYGVAYYRVQIGVGLAGIFDFFLFLFAGEHILSGIGFFVFLGAIIWAYVATPYKDIH